MLAAWTHASLVAWHDMARAHMAPRGRSISFAEPVTGGILRTKDVYELEVGDHLLSFEQGRSSIGTTIWDGSIVMAKYLEHACGNTIPAIKGKR